MAKRFVRTISVFLTVVLSAIIARAGPAGQEQEEFPVFRVDVKVVNLSVSVAAAGRIGNLAKENFRVFEKNLSRPNSREKEVTVSSFYRYEDLPLRAGVLMDTSGSVEQQFLYQKDVAKEIINLIIKRSVKGENDRAFVAGFSYEGLAENPAESIFVLRQNWTSDISSLVKAVKEMRLGGASPLFGSIGLSAKKFKKEISGDCASFLIVISDGQNNLPLSNLQASVSLAQSVNLPIYTICTLDYLNVDPKVVRQFVKNLRTVAKLTGGRFSSLPKLSDLPRIAAQMIRDLENQFYLSYKLDPDYQTGDKISVRVEVGKRNERGQWKRVGTELLHRAGYVVE